MKAHPISPEEIINKLKLKTHPEGGFYRELYRSPSTFSGKTSGFPSGRCFYTNIYFLLRLQDVSKLHKIKSDEIWHFHLGDPLTIVEIDRKGKVKRTVLGPLLEKGQALQHCVPKNTWFGAYPNKNSSFSLVSCTVSPGFDFRDFKMGDQEQLVAEYPDAKSIIRKLT